MKFIAVKKVVVKSYGFINKSIRRQLAVSKFSITSSEGAVGL